MVKIIFGIIIALIIAFCSIWSITNKAEKIGIALLFCDLFFVCFWVV